MTFTLPSLAPTGYSLDYTDFLHTKVGKDGRQQLITGQVTIPSGTTSGTIVGLFPFEPGFKFPYGGFFNVGALGTSVTITLGYLYYDSTQPGTSNSAGYLAASTTAAAGGNLAPNVVAGSIYDTVANGWVVALIGGATTGSAGVLTYNTSICYDISGISN